MRRALLTGITGMDGSHLADLLLQNGYEVWGVIRRSSSFNTDRIAHLYQDPHCEGNHLHLVYGDLLDGCSLTKIINEVRPHEVYHLAAQSHVRVSFDQPVYTFDVVAGGTLRLLEACRTVQPMPKFLLAASSEMFGGSLPPQNEHTRFDPRSPYAVAKVAAYHQVVNYREAYGMFACSSICFNHCGPRRGETFVTRKITRAATRIKLGLQGKLYLGNLDAKRDFGYAPDYVRAMWMIMQAEKPDDFVVATGSITSIAEFADYAFDILGLKASDHIVFDERYLRPTEVNFLQGDARKIRETLGWEPKVSFEEMVGMMVKGDLELAEKEKMVAKK